MRPTIKAILTEAVKHNHPDAFEIDLARDIEYLYNHDPERFVWVLYRNGTQLFPAATDIPSPFVGHPPFESLEYARAFLRTYGDAAAGQSGTNGGAPETRWFVFNGTTMRQQPATEAIFELEKWQRAKKGEEAVR